MKIGILTFHEADNYGAVLQAYALQTVLERLGAESEFIAFERQAVRATQAASANPLILRIKAEGEKRAEHFARFRDRYLHISPPFPKESGAQINDLYDRFIAGSDQIWNLTAPEFDARYFLPFAAPEKRYSYAASFGTSAIPENVRAWCAVQLSEFTGLSVREESGRQLIRELTGRDALVCPDPTLLLDRDEWNTIATPVPAEPYALLFLLQYNAELAEAAKKWSEKLGVSLKVVTAAYMPRFGFEAWSGTGIEEWVGLIAGAQAVFTNSFHGAVFSLIYRRLLYIGLLEGNLSGRNGRITELMRATGIGDCIGGEPRIAPEDEWVAYLREKRTEAMVYLEVIIKR